MEALPSCIVCRSANLRQVIQPYPFYQCVACGVVCNFGYAPLPYTADYFLDDYRRQYGKTYADDFDAIYRSARARLDAIFAVRGNRRAPRTLLDIGSALGFFLKAAHDRGIPDCTGIEISDYAATYCREHFGIPVINLPFDQADIAERYDIITAWYFLEHCADPASVLERIYRLLTPAGVFAFSVPSNFGPMYRFHREEWAREHPMDHRIDYSPRSVKRHLRSIGFTKISMRPAAVHPERLMRRDSILYPGFSRLYRAASTMTNFSDTLEVYAVK